MTPRTAKLFILSIILAPATFYLAHLFNQLESDPEVVFLITRNAVDFLVRFIIAFGAFTILAGILAATNPKPLLRFVLSAFQGVVFWIGLFLTNENLNNPTRVSIDAVLSLLLTLGIFYFVSSVIVDQKLLIKFSPSRIYPRNIRSLLLITTILLSGNFYFSYSEMIQKKGFELPSAVLDSITGPVLDLVEKNLSSQMESFLEDKMGAVDVNQKEGVENFLTGEIEETLQEGEGRKKLLELGGITLPPQGELDLKDIGPAIQKKIQEAMKPYQPLIAPIITLLLFLSLQLIDVLIAMIALAALSIIFKILVMINFAHFEKHQEEVERLVF